MVWRDAVPREALRYDFLLSAIFALTALHRAFEMPVAQARLINLALQYQTQAVTRFRNVLHDIGPESCNAAFAFSSLTMFVSLALPPSEPSDATAQTLLPLPHLRGIAAIVLQSKEIFSTGPLALLRHNPPGIPLLMKMTRPEYAHYPAILLTDALY